MNQSEILRKTLTDLRNRNEDIRLAAALALQTHVVSVCRDSPGEVVVKFMNEVRNRIQDMVNSANIDEKKGGVLAIEYLIDVDTNEDNATKIARSANALRNVLPNNDPSVMSLATRALGRLAQSGGTLAADIVEFEVGRALEWLQAERTEPKRHAAVLLLRDFAVMAPTLFYVYVQRFFDVIWVAVVDAKIQIRDAAIEALRLCFVLVTQRESRQRSEYLKRAWEESQNGLKSTNAEVIHGSLMILSELVITAPDFMETRFREACEILKLKDHRRDEIRRQVMALMPQLAAFRPPEFVSSQNLKQCMAHVLNSVDKDSDKATAFLALGELTVAVKANSGPYVGSIFTAIQKTLTTKKGKNFCYEVLTCISMLAEAMGESLQREMGELLDKMFLSGLSPQLIKALSSMSATMPDLVVPIQYRLLDSLAIILDGQPFRLPGTPAKTPPGLSPQTVIKDLTTVMRAEAADPAIRTFALQTLGTFDFGGINLSEFVRTTVVTFLEDEASENRTAAAATCCSLLVRKDEVPPTSGHAAIVINEVLEKLLMMGIADPIVSIREAVLRSLDARFDHHLAQAENLRSLFIALNDEKFEVRELAISTIGRLTIRNPAYVMPSLRKTLIQLLTELEFSGDVANKEESAKLLSRLIASSQRLIKPYVEPIIKALLPKLEKQTGASSSVAACVLGALGELAQVAGEDMCRYIDQLLPLIIDTLQDQSSVSKREIALRTLGQLCQSTGHVVAPYMDYPNLLNILINSLKAEQARTIRREIIKVMGILGALDPYRYKLAQIKLRQESKVGANTSDIMMNQDASSLLMTGLSPSSEEYYPTVAITALMSILRDPSLSKHHRLVVTTVMQIFQSLGRKAVPFLPQIMPPLLNVMHTCDPSLRETLFQNMGQFVNIVKQRIREYLDPLFELIHKYWDTPLITQIIVLVEEISTALNDEFKVYLPVLIPQMLKILHSDSTGGAAREKILRSLETFGTNLDDYLHLVIPAIVRLFDANPDTPASVRRQAVKILGSLCAKLNFSEYASRIIHPLARVLASNDDDALRNDALETLCQLVQQLGSDYAVFVPMVGKIISRWDKKNNNYNEAMVSRYEILIVKLLKGQLQPPEIAATSTSTLEESETQPDVRLAVNQGALKKAWEASQRSTKDDWLEWIRKFSVELLKQSSSPALRACWALAQVYYPLAKQLFNASFVSCWTEINDQFQEELVHSLETALVSPNIPAEILQQLLNLAEFMEHDDKALPIDIKKLGRLAEKCHAYAKALHYKEYEFQSRSTKEGINNVLIESLISINNQLGQPDAAEGILVYAKQQDTPVSEIKPSVYEKLQRWDDALDAYEQQLRDTPMQAGDLGQNTLGRMRCLHAGGQWEQLAALCHEKWRVDDQTQVAPLACAACWNLGVWDRMNEYVQKVEETSVSGLVYRAVVSINEQRFPKAYAFIDRARELLDTELTALVGESYDRAYRISVQVQQLAELEEVIDYKISNNERRATIKKMWNKRLLGCQLNVEVWQRVLAAHQLVLPPNDDVETWLQFASLCRKSGRLRLAHKTLVKLLGTDPGTSDFVGRSAPLVAFGYIKYLWATGEQAAALKHLQTLTRTSDARNNTELLGQVFLKLGEWRLASNDSEAVMMEAMSSFEQSITLQPQWYKAWHAWGRIHFDLIAHHEKTGNKTKVNNHLLPAVRGFFKAISLGGGGATLQDSLRLLTIFFKYGHQRDLEVALMEGFNTANVDTWLEVIPQIIARIHTPNQVIGRLIMDLLANVGRNHPQALVYPITVASKSPLPQRQVAARNIMDRLRKHSPKLVEAALLVSEELIRVAILWHEMWHEALEEASRLYFGDSNVAGMISTLQPLHVLLAKGPQTLREVAFQQAFGRDLDEAYEWCQRYEKSKKVNDLNQAWDLYYHVFRRINKQLPQMNSLELQYISPKLLQARDLELAMPGTYRAGAPIVHIRSFSQTLTIITSKQRPRKLAIMGSNGREYQFLLKGHEDLRQDERVMQLFGLINTLLSSDPVTSRKHLAIMRYDVVPLAPNSGVLSWVPNCDTLHALIKEYRESRKILLNIEHRLMLQMAPSNYDTLQLIQKVEVFEYALENTTGQDLYKVLWLKSPNSEAWLERRTNYTRSLGVMSMAGYILGLGDRHPSNIMLDRYTGKLLHIDFGDCFEVAMNRDKYPEQVPFRLTRMLINAMEVSGIEGNYRSTCEEVMRVLRENRDALKAVLEAFVYDPMVNWRIIADEGKEGKDKTADSKEGENKEGIGAPPTADRARRTNEANLVTTDSDESVLPALNARAVQIVNRIHSKLTGRDFGTAEPLDVKHQVRKLIQQATSHTNLCQSYLGWCPFW